MQKEQDVKPSVLERHAQTIMVFIITAMIAWVGTSVSTQRTEIALLQQAVSDLKIEVTDFTRQPRFTKQDFTDEMRLYDNRIKLIELELQKADARLNSKDERIRDLETWQLDVERAIQTPAGFTRFKGIKSNE